MRAKKRLYSLAWLLVFPVTTAIVNMINMTAAPLGIQAAIIVVNSAQQLENAIGAAAPGDTIEVVNGVYDAGGSLTVYASGTALHPIVIRAQQVGMAELTGETYFAFRQCAYVILEGFLFTGTDETAVKLEACHHIRITRNTFRLNETESLKWVIVQGIWNDPNAESHHNRIDHNLFENKQFPGNYITIDGSGDPVYQSSQYDRIDHNHFRNIGPRRPNEMEAVRIGWSEMSLSSGFTVLESNLFEDCDGDPEIVSVKTCDDTIRYNTFRRSQGTLSLRHGHRSTVEGNFFLGEGKAGTGGVRIYGDDHRIFNNYFSGLTGNSWDAPITLTNGDYDGGSNLTRHWRINRATIVNNTLAGNDHHIEIGFTNSGSYTKAPRDVIMANNLVWGKQHELVKVMTAPVNMVWEHNLMHPDSAALLGISATAHQIRLGDPQLVYADSLWKLGANSTAIDSASAAYSFVHDDMEGHPRDGAPDIGADEYSTAAPLRRPLREADVGPFASGIITAIDDPAVSTRVETFELLRIYPNPFNPLVNIRLRVPRRMAISREIYDVSGRLVERRPFISYAAGEHVEQWDGGQQPSGIYFVRFMADAAIVTGRLLLIK